MTKRVSILEAACICPINNCERYVSAEEAKNLLTDYRQTEFYFLNQRVIPKYAYGKYFFARWPQQGLNTLQESEGESACHLLAKEVFLVIFSSGYRLVLQKSSRRGYPIGKPIYFDILYCEPEVGLKLRSSSFRLQPDILFKCKNSPYGNWVALEFRNTSKVNYYKRELLKRQGIPTFEIDIREYASKYYKYSESILRTDLEKLLKNEILCRLIVNPEKKCFKGWSDDELNLCFKKRKKVSSYKD